MYFYYRAQKQVRVTRSKYLYYAIINRVGGLARAIPGSYDFPMIFDENLWIFNEKQWKIMEFHDFPRFLRKSGKYEIHPPKLCAGLYSTHDPARSDTRR